MPSSPVRPKVPSPSCGISSIIMTSALGRSGGEPADEEFLEDRKSSAIGTVITTEAAITAPQSVLNSVENSASPMAASSR